VEKELRVEKGLMGYLLPIVLPLAVVGAIEIYNKMLVGSIVRPWVAVYEHRTEQQQYYGE
jgi:hypothetical protein